MKDFRKGLGPVFISLFLAACGGEPDKNLIEQEESNMSNPLLERLNSTKTGINFSNNLVETPAINILTYEYFYNGGGVAIGDIDNDGLDDIYFTANLEDNKLYLNKGDFQFDDISEQAGVTGGRGWTTGVTMVDINNDGYLDIYVCRSGKFEPENRRNQLFVNNGDLTFTEKAQQFGLDDPSYSTQALFFDYDRDNDLDMYLLNHSTRLFLGEDAMKLKSKRDPYAGDKLYRNNEGKFEDVSASTGIIGNSLGYGLGVAAGDINNDGWPDLFVTNDYVEPDYLYINDQNGAFKESIKKYTKHISNFAMGVDIADFNNDGYADIMVADMVAEDNYRQKTNMRSMNPEEFYQAVKFGFHYQYMHNTLQLNNGNGSFSEISQLAGVSNTDWSWASLFADFDNNGLKDLVITNGFRKEFSNKDFVKKRKAVYKENSGADQRTQLMAMRKLLDEIPSAAINNYIFKNEGEYNFANRIEEWGFNQPSFSNGASLADLDNDGDLDIVISNIDQEAFIFKNRAEELNNSFLIVKLAGPDENQSGLGSKVEVYSAGGYQYVEHFLTRGYQSSLSDRLHFGIEKNDTVDSLKITWTDGRVQTLFGVRSGSEIVLDYKEASLPGNISKAKSKPYLVDDTNNTLRHKHTENEYDDFELQVLLPHKMSQFGPALAVKDVNNDGLDDIFIGGSTGYGASLYIQSRSEGFVLQKNTDLQNDSIHEDVDALFFDADSDGDQDLYVVSGGNEDFLTSDKLSDRLYTNNGNGVFTKTKNALPSIEVSGGVVRNIDIDKDGDQDLFVGGRLVPGKYPYPADSYILINDEGVFRQYQTNVLEELGLITSALVTDYDSDGDYDIMVAGEWMPITILTNDGGEISEKTELGESTGWWFHLNQADLDEDGDTDYIAGNLGLNSKYKASQKEPFEIFASDFDENGNFDIVLSYHENGKLLPLRGRQCSSEQMPEIAERFSTYDQFGSATLMDVYGKDMLEAALHYEAVTFESVYLENTGNGGLSLKPLPIEAQFSTINASIITDVDGDLKDDILIAGNMYPVEVETTRNDASIGLMLKRSSKALEAIHVSKSGFNVSGQVKAMHTVKTERGQAILVVKNDDVVQVLKVNESIE